jgi:hypothetical protein
MSTSIKTTGQLREFLVKMMLCTKEGSIDADKARNITKLAAQINESFYSEIKIAKVMTEAGNLGDIAKLGDLPINKTNE